MSPRDVALAVRAEHVVKRYGERTVFDGFSLEMHPGEVWAVTGPNGSGKTTLGRLLLGLEAPDAGTVARPAGLTTAAVFQDDRLCPHLSAVGNVRLVLGRRGRAGAEGELRGVGLAEGDLHRPVRELSGGQRRRVAIARALAARADLVVLDEPLTGIDDAARAVVLAHLRERLAGSIAVLITHDPEAARGLATRAVRLPA